MAQARVLPIPYLGPSTVSAMRNDSPSASMLSTSARKQRLRHSRSASAQRGITSELSPPKRLTSWRVFSSPITSRNMARRRSPVSRKPRPTGKHAPPKRSISRCVAGKPITSAIWRAVSGSSSARDSRSNSRMFQPPVTPRVNNQHLHQLTHLVVIQPLYRLRLAQHALHDTIQITPRAASLRQHGLNFAQHGFTARRHAGTATTGRRRKALSAHIQHHFFQLGEGTVTRRAFAGLAGQHIAIGLIIPAEG